MTRAEQGWAWGLGIWACLSASWSGELSALTQESGLYYIDNKKPLSSFENDLLGAMPQEIPLETAGTVSGRRGVGCGSSLRLPSGQIRGEGKGEASRCQAQGQAAGCIPDESSHYVKAFRRKMTSAGPMTRLLRDTSSLLGNEC